MRRFVPAICAAMDALESRQLLSVTLGTNVIVNPGAEYGYQDFSRLHVLAVNYIYHLPSFENRTDLLGHLLGGWQLSGVTKWNTGRRFSVTAGTTTMSPAFNASRNPTSISGIESSRRSRS